MSGEVAKVVFKIEVGTKAFPNVIVATFPTTLSLTVTNKATGSKFTVNTGEEVQIPVGEYSVSGKYAPKASQAVLGTSVYLSKSPAFSILQDVSIATNIEECSLTVNYQSWVLAVDSNEVSKWSMSMNYNATDIDFMTDGDTWWIFCTGDLSERFVTTTITPKDIDGHTATTFNLTTSASYAASNGGYVVQPGKWYWLHPEGVTTGSAQFTFSFPTWQDGTWD